MQIIKCYLLLLVITFSQALSAETVVWDNDGGDGLWSTPTNWSSDQLPSSNDEVVFNSTSIANCLIDQSVSVKGLRMDLDYSGMLTQAASSGLTIGSTGIYIQSGIFVGGNGVIDCGGLFHLAAGQFTSTTGELRVKGNVTISGGSFSHNTGTLYLYSATKTINAGTENFYNVTINQGNYGSLIITGDLNIENDLRIESISALQTGAVKVSGDITTIDTQVTGDAQLQAVGDGAQLLSADGGIGALPSFKINKSGGVLSIADTIEIDTPAHGWVHESGQVDAGTSTIVFKITNTVEAAGMSFYNVRISAAGTNSLSVIDAMHVANDLTIDGMGYFYGSVSVGGDLCTTDASVPGSAVIEFNGSGDQLIHAAGGVGAIPGIHINKPSGTLTIADTIEVDGGSGWTHTQGDVNAGASTVVFTITNTITAAGMSFNDVRIQAANTNSMTVIDAWNIDNNLTIQGMGYFHGLVKLGGDLCTTDAHVPGSAIIEFNGAGDQLLHAAGGVGGIPGVSINKQAGTLSIADTIEVDGVSGWSHVQGAVEAGTSEIVFTITNIITVAASGMSFHDVRIRAAHTNSMTVTDTWNISNDLTIEGMGYFYGMVKLGGDLCTLDSHVPGSAIIEFNGLGDQQLHAAGGVGAVPGIRINKPSGTLTISDTIEVDGGSGWRHVNGIVDAGTSKVQFKVTNFIDAENMYFYDVEFDAASTNTINCQSDVQIENDFVISSIGYINGASINVSGDVIAADANVSGSATLTLNGAEDQSLHAATSGADIVKLVIDKPSGALNISGQIDVKYDWIQNAGDVNPGNSLVRFIGNTSRSVVNARLFDVVLEKSPKNAQLNLDGSVLVLGSVDLKKGTLDLNDAILTVHGNLIREDNATGLLRGASSVLLEGGDQSLLGSFHLHNLTKVSTAGAVLSVEPGKTLTVANELTLNGAVGTPLIVKSVTDGSSWDLVLQVGASQHVAHVAAQDSDASDGETIYVLESGIDNGNNINWVFPVTNNQFVWDGGASDNKWSSPLNWDNDVVPHVNAQVTFNNLSDKNVLVDVEVNVASITVDNGYDGVIDQQQTVTTNGDLLIDAGRWQANDQTINVLGSMVIANERRRFFAGSSTIVLSGSGALANKHGTNRFYNIHVAADGHTTTISDRVRAHRFNVGAGTLDCAGYSVYVGASTSSQSEKIFSVNESSHITNVGGFRFYGGTGHTYEIDGASLDQLAVKKTGCLTFLNGATYKIITRGLSAGCVALLGDCTLDLNGFDVNTLHDFHVGKRAFSPTLLCGSGVLSCRDFELMSNGSGVPTVHLGSATVHVKRHWRTHSSAVILAGTSHIIFDGDKRQIADFGSNAQLATLSVDKSANRMFFKDNGFAAQTLHVHACQTVRFQAGQTFSILDNLTLAGTASCGVKVESTSAGSAWYFNVDSAATQSLSYVCAQDSDASLGTSIDATNNGCDEGGNTNWNFVSTQPLLATLSLVNPPTTMEALEEDAETFTFDVALTGTVSGTVVLDIDSSAGVAAVNDDFILSTTSLSFTASGTQQFTLTITDDAIIEGPESLILTLNSAQSVAIADVIQLTIVENDQAPVPSITIEDALVDEGDLARVIIKLDKPADQEITVVYATADASPVEAVADVDYSAQSGTVTIGIGSDSADIFIQTTADNDVEADEQFLVELSAPVNADISDAQATVTIVNNDVINEPPVVMNDSYPVTGQFLEGGALSVAAPGVLGNDSDPEGATLTTTLVSSDTNGTLSLHADGSFDFTHDDSESPATFTFVYAVTDNVNAPVQGTVTIHITPVNEAPELVAIPSPLTATEDQIFTYTLAASDPEGDNLNFELTGAPNGMQIINDIITWTPEEGGSVPVTIVVSDSEGLSDSQNIVINVAPVNDPPVITGSPNSNAVVGELYTFVPSANDEENDTLSFAITNKPVWANFDTGTGALSGTPTSDDTGIFTNIIISVTDGTNDPVSLPSFAINVLDASHVLTVNNGSGSGTYTTGADIEITADAAPNGKIFYIWTGDTNYINNISSHVATVTMPDVDIALTATYIDPVDLYNIQFEENVYQITEGDSSVLNLVITSNIASQLSAPVDIPYTVIPNSATAEDYGITSGLLHIPAGATNASLELDVKLDDNYLEGVEDFSIELGIPTPSNVAVLGQNSTAVISIEDPLAVYFTTTGSTEVEPANGQSITGSVTIQCNKPLTSTEELSASWSIGGTATRGVDYTIAGNLNEQEGLLRLNAESQTQTLHWVVLGDTFSEPDETIQIELSSPVGLVLGEPAVHVITINDTDMDTAIPQVSMASASQTVQEPVGSQRIMIDVLLNPIPQQDIEVSYVCSDGTATGAQLGIHGDYVSHAGTIEVLAGQGLAQIPIVLLDDEIVESDETFIVEITSVNNAHVDSAQNQTVVTIEDTDVAAPTFDVTTADGNTVLISNSLGGNFVASMHVLPKSENPNATILYSVDGGVLDTTVSGPIAITESATVQAQASINVNGVTYTSGVAEVTFNILSTADFSAPFDGGTSDFSPLPWEFSGPTDDLTLSVSTGSGVHVDLIPTGSNSSFADVPLDSSGATDVSTVITDALGNSLALSSQVSLKSIKLTNPHDVFVRVGDSILIENDSSERARVYLDMSGNDSIELAPDHYVFVTIPEMKANGYDLSSNVGGSFHVDVATNPFDATNPFYAQIQYTRNLTVTDDRLSYVAADPTLLTVAGNSTGHAGYQYNETEIQVTPLKRGSPFVFARLPQTGGTQPGLIVAMYEVIEFSAERVLLDPAYARFKDENDATIGDLISKTAIRIVPDIVALYTDTEPNTATTEGLDEFDAETFERIKYLDVELVEFNTTIDAGVDLKVLEGEEEIVVGTIAAPVGINAVDPVSVTIAVSNVILSDIDRVTSPDRSNDTAVTVQILGAQLQSLSGLLDSVVVTRSDAIPGIGSDYIVTSEVVVYAETPPFTSQNLTFTDTIPKKENGVKDFVYTVTYNGIVKDNDISVSKHYSYGRYPRRFFTVANKTFDTIGSLVVGEAPWDEGSYGISYSHDIAGYILPPDQRVSYYATQVYQFFKNPADIHGDDIITIGSFDESVLEYYRTYGSVECGWPALGHPYAANDEFVVGGLENVFDGGGGAEGQRTPFHQNLIDQFELSYLYYIWDLDVSRDWDFLTNLDISYDRVAMSNYQVGGKVELVEETYPAAYPFDIKAKRITKEAEVHRVPVPWFFSNENGDKKSTQILLNGVSTLDFYYQQFVDNIEIEMHIVHWPAGGDGWAHPDGQIEVIKFGFDPTDIDTDIVLSESWLFGDLYQNKNGIDMEIITPDMVTFNDRGEGMMWLHPGLYVFDIGTDLNIAADGASYYYSYEGDYYNYGRYYDVAPSYGLNIGPTHDQFDWNWNYGEDKSATQMNVSNLVVLKVEGTSKEATSSYSPNSFDVWSDVDGPGASTETSSLSVGIKQLEYTLQPTLEHGADKVVDLSKFELDQEQLIALETRKEVTDSIYGGGIYHWQQVETISFNLNPDAHGVDKFYSYRAQITFPRLKYFRPEDMQLNASPSLHQQVSDVKIMSDVNLLGIEDSWTSFKYYPVMGGVGTVNMETGNLYASFPLKAFNTQAAGPDLSIMYNSLDASNHGWGAGWRTNYDLRIYENYSAGPWSFLDPLPPGTELETITKISDHTGYLYDVEDVDFTKREADKDGSYPADPSTASGPAPEWRMDEVFRVIYPHDHTRRYYFNEQGYLLRVADMRNESIVVSRDPVSQVITEISDELASGRRTVKPLDYLVVDNNKQVLTQINGGLSDVWHITQNDAHYDVTVFKQITAYGENEWKVAYTADHLVETITDPDTQTITFNIDSGAVDDSRAIVTTNTWVYSNLSEFGGVIADAGGKQMTYDWNDASRKLTVTSDVTGLSSETTYNEYWQIVKEEVKRDTDTIQQHVYNYVTYGLEDMPFAPGVSLLVSEKTFGVEGVVGGSDQMTLSTYYTYYLDAKRAGRVRYVSDGILTLAEFNYNDNGFLVESLDARKKKTIYSGHDHYGNVGLITDPSNFTMTYTYGDKADIGVVETITDSRSGITVKQDLDDQLRYKGRELKAGSTVLNKVNLNLNKRFQATTVTSSKN